MPPTTAVVDSSIKLFAQLLPAQDGSSALSTVNQLVTEMKSPKFDKNVGRRAAVHINSVTAIVMTLHSVMDGSHKSARETLSRSNITSAISGVLKVSFSVFPLQVNEIKRRPGHRH
jgi:HEAT repeat-containing protein 5